MYVVAEVGSNWSSLSDCIESVAAAKSAGADCVKFQAFTADALLGPNAKPMGHMLPLEWLPKLKMKATACGIDLACTAFSPELVKAVDPYVAWHKVASSDMAWPQLLDAVIATGKAMVISTGGASHTDIERTLAYVNDRRDDAKQVLTLLYCVAAYPARTTDLEAMADIARHHEVWGISDHSTEVFSIPLEAQKYGAHMLEKHFTAFPELHSPDRPHSLTAAEFKRMVMRLRGEADPMQPSYEEVDMLLRHRRRLVATKDIQPGDMLVYGVNYGAYRVAMADMKGYGAMEWPVVEGAEAPRPILRGQPIGPGDLS